jgi:hypothetical protein
VFYLFICTPFITPSTLIHDPRSFAWREAIKMSDVINDLQGIDSLKENQSRMTVFVVLFGFGLLFVDVFWF